MKSNHFIGAAALAVAVIMAGVTAHAGAQPKAPHTIAPLTIAPNQEIGLDAGPRRIAGAFHPAGGNCALSLTIVESYHSDNDPTEPLPESVQVTVDPGQPVRLSTAEGEQALFECLPGAQAMKASLRDQVAAVFTP